MKRVELEKNLAEIKRKWAHLKKEEAKLLVALKRAEDELTRSRVLEALHEIKAELVQVQYEIAHLIRLSKMQVAPV